MVHNGHSRRFSHGSQQKERRMDRGRGVSWEHAIDAIIFTLFVLGIAFIFAELWVPIIPYIQNGIGVVNDAVLFMLSLTMFLSILWNIAFYLKRRKELQVARKLIRWVASQRSVVPRTDRERERVDRLLKTAIWSLRKGEDVQDIIDRLNEGTSGGEALPDGWARSDY